MSKSKETDQQLDLRKKKEEPKKVSKDKTKELLKIEVQKEDILQAMSKQNSAPKDDKLATNEADAGRMDSSRYEEDAANQLTPNSHWGKELLKNVKL